MQVVRGLNACLTPRVLQSLPMIMTRESVDDTEGVWELPIGLWRCSSLSREDSFTFSLVI